MEYLYGTDEMELESINNDADLTFSEVKASLISIGTREYDDDEDFEVDHKVCPHCGTEAIMLEYNYTGKGGIKEDIICPKCKKIICTLEEAGYYKVELMEQ